MTVRAAVLDVGSNSVRLLLLERMTPHGAIGERRATVTGLRKGAHADGSVAPDALERLDACLATYADAIAAAGGPPVVAVGTAAVREAPNRDEISAVVRRRLNTALVVATGEQEATLAYRGARMALDDPDGPCRMIDIGGASTEIVAGDASGPHHVVSLPLGVVRNAGDTVEGARAEAHHRVAEATTTFPVDGPVIGLAGTVTQAAALCNGRYDPDEIHRQRLHADSLARVLADAAAVDLNARRAMPGMHPDRADVIVNGMAILLGAMSALAVDEVIVSERDLLDGIAGDPALVPATLTE
jgi:exopolyphosphatase/guanosine-5'-triphosphate,3'-diphosphate pyrophosphatase